MAETEDLQDNPVEDLEESEAEENEPDDDESEAEPEVSEDDEEETEPVEPELVDVELDGKTYKVDPSLRDAFMMRADYSRKTQEVAEARKAFEQEREQFQERAKVEKEIGGELVQLQAAENQLEQFRQLNWQELQQQDPNMHANLLTQYTMLKDQTDALRGQVANKARTIEFQRQQDFAKRTEQTKAQIVARVPDWNEAKESEVKAYARSKGVPDRDFQAALNNDAYIAEILADALLGHKVKTERKKTKAARPATPAPEPLPQLKGKGAPQRGPSDRQSTAEWIKRRNRQLERSA